MDNSKITSHFK